MLDGAVKLLGEAERINSSRCIALACQIIGGAYRRRGEYDIAKQYLERALECSEEMSKLQAQVHIQLGAMYNDQRAFSQAKPHLRQALKIHTASNDVQGIAIAHFNLGNYFRLQEQNDEARDHSSKSLKFYSQAGDEAGVAICLGSLGYLARDRRDFDDAEFRFSTAQEILARRGDVHNQAKLSIERAFIKVAGGHYDIAISLIEKGESLAKGSKIPQINFNGSLLRAMIAFKKGVQDLSSYFEKMDSIASVSNIAFSIDELRLLATTALGADAEKFIAMVKEHRIGIKAHQKSSR